MNKRIISLCLALVLLLCLLPAAAPTVAAAGDVAINETNFPDASFRSYVSEELDENGDGVLSPTEIASIKWIDCNTRGIASLQGIEFFVALERLDCSHNVLTSLDAVYNENLTHLDCADNNLFILDPSIFPSLKALVCYYNKLSMLDLSANPKLRWVSCHDNKMYNLQGAQVR